MTLQFDGHFTVDKPLTNDHLFSYGLLIAENHRRCCWKLTNSTYFIIMGLYN